MRDRPKRKRKPTQAFEYRVDVAKSKIATVDENSPRRSGPAPNRRGCSAVKKQIISESNTQIARDHDQRGSRPSRQDTSRGHGRDRSSGSTGRLSTRDPTPGTDEESHNEPDGTFSAILSDPTDDNAPVDDMDDSDFDENEHKAHDSPRDTPISRCRLLRVKTILSRLSAENDEVIEQWYADPYERINPDKPSYDQWRLRNLETGLMNKGFTAAKSRQIASWLMRCNGQFKDFKMPERKSRAKTARPSSTNNLESPKTTIDADRINLSRKNDLERVQENGNDPAVDKSRHTDRSNANATSATCRAKVLWRPDGQGGALRVGWAQDRQEDTFVDENLAHTPFIKKSAYNVVRSIQEHDGVQDERTEKGADRRRGKEFDELSNLERLAMLRRGLKIFDMIYGSDGPQASSDKFELNHFSRASTLPVLVPKSGLRTQGHYALQEVTLPASGVAFANGGKGRKERGGDPARKPEKALTEDPDFGLTFIPESELASEADMKLYYSQFSRKKHGNQFRLVSYSDGQLDVPQDEDFPHHLGKNARRALIQESNRRSAMAVSEALKQTVFDWETPHTMNGGVPKYSKDDPLREGEFALGERRVWEDLRRRQAILDRGGAEAARLLEQEWEELQLEIKREERRRQHERFRIRKRAEREWAFSDNNEGTRKKVRISDWTHGE